MADIQPSATFLHTCSSQLETDKDSNSFDTTLGDHFPHDTASMNADMLDRHGKDKSDTSQVIPPKPLSYPANVDGRPSASPTCATPLEVLDQHQGNQGKCSHSSCDNIGVDAEMLDALPTAGNSNTAMINVLDDILETLCLTPPIERHTSVTPSEKSSAWNISPVHDSRYIWSASSPPLTQYLQTFKQLDS
jgi:hypothetical protein